MKAAAIRALLDPFDPLPLECDGFTRVASYALTQAGIAHLVKLGSVRARGGSVCVSTHFWIEVGDWIVDYRLRMWAGPDMPHGVFKKPSEIRYDGELVELPCSSLLFRILTDEMPNAKD